MLSLSIKNLSTKIKNQRKKTKTIFKIICHNYEQKKHYAIKWFNTFKNAKIKTNINVVEQTKKEKFLKKNSQVFKNSRRIKNELNLVYKITITNENKKNYSTKVLLNDVVEINIINQRFVVVSNFYSINSELFESHFMNDKKIYYYKIYEIKLILKNNWQRKRIFAIVFYAIDKQSSKLILNFSKLKQLSVVIDYEKFNWRYNFDSSSFELNFVKEFSKTLTDDASLYAIMTAFIAFSHEKQNVHVNAIREKIDSNIDETFAIFKKFVKF